MNPLETRVTRRLWRRKTVLDPAPRDSARQARKAPRRGEAECRSAHAAPAGRSTPPHRLSRQCGGRQPGGREGPARLGKHGVADFVAERGAGARGAVPNQQRGRQELRQRHVYGGHAAGVGGQAVDGVLEQEGHLRGCFMLELRVMPIMRILRQSARADPRARPQADRVSLRAAHRRDLKERT